MITTIVKTLTSNKLLILIWTVIASLLVGTWSLSPEALPAVLVSQLPKIVLLKLLLVLLLISVGLTLSLFILYKKQAAQINSQTCEWMQDPPVWKHKTNGRYYCPRCAPNPSILSPDLYCSKCTHGFGKGEVFIADD